VFVVFDHFLDLINRLRGLVEDYRVEFEKSEALTRYCLVDPFLKIWGWDVNDPSLVRPEFSTEAGRPDYALLIEGKPLIYVGVKALGRQEKIEQYINYCITTGVPYFITTDGVKWEVYDTHLPKPLHEKKIAEWNILEDKPNEIIQKAFVIWRPNRELLRPLHPLPVRYIGENLKEKTKLEGISIDKLKVKPGQEIPYKKIVFPDGREYKLESWRSLLLGIISWLIDTGKIRREDIPIATPKSRKRYILNTEPRHKDGASFKDFKKLGPYYVETNIGSKTTIKWRFYLLKKYNVNASNVLLQ
jgi:predicted type IV restriction endonuclease